MTLQLLAKQIVGKNKHVNEALKSFKKILPELSVSSDGLITRGQRIVLPASLHKKVLDSAHAGHLGINSMKRHLRSKYCFAGMDTEIANHVAACHACNVNTDKSVQEPLKPTISPEDAWAEGKGEVDVDFTSQTPSGDYVLVCICERSRYPVLILTKGLTTASAIAALKVVFKTFGVPVVLKTDNGPAFRRTFTIWLKSIGCKHRKITPLWPPANGTAERFMKNINKVIRCALVENLPWKSCINDYLANYRNTPHSMTKCTPSSMMGLLDESGLDSVCKPQKSVNQDSKSKSAMKEYTDKRRNAKAHLFKIGDVVVHKWSRSNKYQAIFDPDCYTITDIDQSMITASRSDHSVTRNSFFFQSARLLGSKPKVIPVIDRPAVFCKQFVIQRQTTPARFAPLTPVTGVENDQVYDFQLPAMNIENQIAQEVATELPNWNKATLKVAL